MLGAISAHRRWLELALAVTLYFGFACYFTWPLVTDPVHIFYGAAGDPYGTMSFFRELVDHHHNPFLPGTISQLSAPEGQPIPWTRDLASMPGVLSLYLLTVAFGAMAADGLYILLGYTLTGVVTFLVARRLTGNPWAAWIAGWAFAFYPYAVLNGQGHIDFIQGWVLILGVWRMVELTWNPTRRNGVLAGLAVALGMWWSAYFILLGGVAYLAAALASLALAWRRRQLRPALVPHAIPATIVVVFLGFLAALSTGASGNSLGLRANDTLQLNTYSARPLEYVIPDAQSPLFGSDTLHYIVTHLHGSNPAEATLYLGVTVILLALLAIGAVLLGRTSPRTRAAVLVLLAVAVLALLTSAPPQGRVLGLVIPFPSHFIMKVTSTWRVYSRFVVVVMLAVSLLAAIGLDALVRRRPWWLKVALMLVASVIVPLDLWSRLAGRTNTIETPPIYNTLARQPPGLVAEYPLTPTGYNNYGDVFFQNVHGKPMVNGYLEGTPEEHRAESLANLASPSTGPRLAALGVRYVLLDATPPGYGLPSPGTPGRGFRLIARSSYADLYAVDATPSAPALPAVGEGFEKTETEGKTTFNWLVQPTGTIEIRGACSVCRGVLRLTAVSFAQARTITVSDRHGHVLARRRVGGLTPIAVPLTFTREADLRLNATPGPQSIHATTGSPDPRSVSVEVRNLDFTGVAKASKRASKTSKH